MSNKTLQESIKQLEMKLQSNPNSRAFAVLADNYRLAGNTDKAIAICQAGLKNHHNFINAYIVLGKCYNDKSDTTEAQNYFNQVLGLNPNNTVAMKYLGDIFKENNNIESAKEVYAKIIELEPTNTEIQAIINNLNKPKDEIPETKTMAELFIKQGKPNKALEIWEAKKHLRKTHTLVLSHLCLILQSWYQTHLHKRYSKQPLKHQRVFL